MIKYAYTILYVNDVQASITFYKNAFGFSKKLLTPENDYGEIISGETTIAFASIELAKSNLKDGFIESSISKKPFGIEMGFTSDTPEELFAKAINAGAIEVEKIITKPWGQKVGYLRDNNGFLIEICSPMN